MAFELEKILESKHISLHMVSNNTANYKVTIWTFELLYQLSDTWPLLFWPFTQQSGWF